MNGPARSPLDDAQLEELAALIHAYLLAPTLAGKQELVEDHQAILLSTEADSVMAGLLLEYDEDEELQHSLEVHRALLLRCRNEGIREAFLGLRRQLSGEHAPPDLSAEDADELVRVIGEFLTTDDWDASRRWLDEHPELLTPQADAVFDRLIDTHERRHERNVVRQLIVHRDLLRACREMGVEAAFDRQLNPPDALDVIAENTIAVLTSRPEAAADWQATVQQSRIRASELEDVMMVALLRAIDALLHGEPADQVAPSLAGPHAICWQRIVDALP